jgi:DNA sulfur modification protein DndC
MGLDRILGIQSEINAAARAQGRPEISLIDRAEEGRIRELIAAGTWPEGWEGDEPTADTVMATVYQNGAVQPLLFSAEDAA